jgi:hypothetical protein
MHSSHMLHEGARPEVVRDILGHANIDVTQNVYGKSWWEERVDAGLNRGVHPTQLCQNCAKTLLICLVGVSFERRADSPNC